MDQNFGSIMRFIRAECHCKNCSNQLLKKTTCQEVIISALNDEWPKRRTKYRVYLVVKCSFK